MARSLPAPALTFATLVASASLVALPPGGGAPAAGAAAAPPTVTVTVRIDAVRALDSIDTTSAADFYPKVRIAGQSFGGVDLEVTDQNEIHPSDWTWSAQVPFTSALATTTMAIEIWDEDDFLNGADNQIDVTTGDSDRTFDGTVHLLDCAAKVPDRGLSGDLATACGTGLVSSGTASERASLRFDVSVDIPDADGDGLYDSWEQGGLDNDGDGVVDVDLPAMGARVDHKDLFVELDSTSNGRLSRADVLAVKKAFAAAPVDAGTRAHELSNGKDAKPNPDGQRGITLHVDAGRVIGRDASEGTALGTCGDGIDNGADGTADTADPDCVAAGAYLDAAAEDPGPADCTDGSDNDADGKADADDPDCLLGDDLGGGGIVTVKSGPACNLDASYYATKQASFDAKRARVFRWALALPLDASCKSSGGWGEIGGNDFMVFNGDGGSFMHELGHNLRLDHGGADSSNCKPNYVSVMNYDQQFAINRVGGGSILDYGPPRLAVDGSSRGNVPGPIDETTLNENTVLDATDGNNQFAYTDSKGAKQLLALNANPNYNADTDPPLDSGFAGNVDNADSAGNPGDCKNSSSSSTLTSQNDWLRISLPFAQFGDSADGPINPDPEPIPTTDELLAHDDLLHATDLSVDVSGPSSAVAGTQATYDVTVRNEGDNPAMPILTLTRPAGSTLVSAASCSGTATLTCVGPQLAPGHSWSPSLTVAFPADLVHVAGHPVDVVTTASVTAVRGSDPDPGDNTDQAATRVVAVADLSVSSALGSAPTEVVIGKPVTVDVSSSTSNAGPSSPMDVRLTTSVQATDGATGAAPSSQLLPAVAIGAPRAATVQVVLTCSAPGQHHFDITTRVAPDRPDDTDAVPGNDVATRSLDVDCVVPVAINVKPGTNVNSVNRTSSSDVPVAVLTTRAGEYDLPLAFDATSVLPLTVRFGPPEVVNAGQGARETHGQAHLEDSYELDERTRDGDRDAVVHFDPTKAQLLTTTVKVCVKGKFRGPQGQAWTFLGCDAIRIVK